MDRKYLEEIKAREQAATSGPWKYNCYGRYEDHDECTVRTSVDEFEVSAKEDAVFIAHARTDIPALISEVERLTEENDVLKPECKAHIRQAQEQEAKDG